MRPKVLDGPKHGFLRRSGTNDHEQPRSVSFGSTRSTRVETRPHIWFVEARGRVMASLTIHGSISRGSMVMKNVVEVERAEFVELYES